MLECDIEQQILLPARVMRIRGHPESRVDSKEVAKLEILTLLSKDCMRVDFSHNKEIYNKLAFPQIQKIFKTRRNFLDLRRVLWYNEIPLMRDYN